MLTYNLDMKDVGEANIILGIKISRTPDGITLSQTNYVDKVIERFKIHVINKSNNPFLLRVVLHKEMINKN